ncbi:MAG: ABC transporter [Gemmatimonadetes bacterium]|nr:MAG: ABC transporter [Gemmatimonadota bacterium]
MRRFGPMFRKEFIQMRRDRLTLGIMTGIPVIQLLLFGFAIQTDVRHIPTVVLDESRTPTSREMIAAFVAQVRNLAILSAAAHSRALPLETRIRPRYNPGLRSANYIVPGLVGVILTITMVLVTAMAIVRERERGTLEQLIVTPITKTELMLGKISPYVGVGLVQMTTVLLLGRFVFDVPLTGNVLLLYGIAFVFIVASLALGLFVSTLVRTQQQAMQTSFFFVLPNILLSGFMFPRQAMPALFQWIGAFLPLTHFLKVLRGILLKGVGVTELWQEMAILLLFATVLIALSVRRFQKTLD